MADLFRVVPRADALLQAVSKRGIEALLTGIIAGPLLSSLRAKRDPTAAPARPGLLPALLAARVLAEASQPRGAARCFPTLTCRRPRGGARGQGLTADAACARS
jgi:hypothetical protein